MDNEGNTTVLFIEEDENVITTNKRVLSKALKGKIHSFSVRTLKEARKTLPAKKTAYDLILLDIRLPDGSGLELIPEIHALTDAPILILSTSIIPPDIIKGIERGGDNHIIAPYEPEAMVALVQVMLKREKKPGSTAPSITIIRGNLTLDLIAKQTYISGIDAGLEGKEFPLLSLLVREEGKTISASRLFEAIFKSDTENDISIVHKLISALNIKLESGECGYTIRNIYGEGFRFEKI